MRVGVVGGAGRWGGNLVRTLREIPGIEVAWTAGRADDWVRWLDEQPKRPDAVAIASPARLHAEHACAALAAGMPVFVEKPLALSAFDAERVWLESRRRDLPVVVDHVHLFNPAWRTFVHRAWQLGGARHVESRAGQDGPFRDDVSTLWDWGAHDVALALDLFGRPPVGVSGRMTAGGNWELSLAFPGGRSWTARVGSHFAAKERNAVARCAGGRLVWDDLAAAKLTVNDAPVPTPAVPPLAVALHAFLGAAIAPAFHPGLGLAVMTVRILAACGRATP